MNMTEELRDQKSRIEKRLDSLDRQRREANELWADEVEKLHLVDAAIREAAIREAAIREAAKRPLDVWLETDGAHWFLVSTHGQGAQKRGSIKAPGTMLDQVRGVREEAIRLGGNPDKGDWVIDTTRVRGGVPVHWCSADVRR